MESTKTDLSLFDVWAALEAAGAVVYEVCDQGVATGEQLIKIGDDHALTVSEAEGYKLGPIDENFGLVPADEYDDEAAEADASDLDGFFGVVGLPGSVHHDYEWFDTESEAEAWVDRRHAETRERNPVIGTLESEVVTAAEAFGRRYRDGNRIYFESRRGGGYGYEPRRGR